MRAGYEPIIDMRKIVMWMPDLGKAGCICVRFEGEKSWIEFRGPPYSNWSLGGESNFERLHNALEGRHASVLHSGDILVLLPAHSDYGAVKKMLDDVLSAEGRSGT